MRLLVTLSGAAVIAGGSAPAIATEPDFGAEAGLNYLSWEDDLGDSATQSVAEFNLAATWRSFGAALSGGWISSDYSSDVDALNGDVSTALDTRVLVEWSPPAFDMASVPATASFDLDVNLPTGKSRLTGLEKNASFDPLLAIYDRFGEGLNVAAGVFLSVEPLAGVSIGAGVKHTWTGEYEPDGDAPNLTLDPADTTALNVQMTWTAPAVIATLGGQVYDPGPVTRNGTDLFDQALTTEINGGLVLKLTPSMQLQTGAFFATRGTDKRLDEISGTFSKEAERLNGDVWGAEATLRRLQQPIGEIRALASYVNAGSSEFDDTAFEYRPERERYDLGVGLYRDLGVAALDAELVYFQWTDKGSALLTELEADGVRAGLRLERTW